MSDILLLVLIVGGLAVVSGYVFYRAKKTIPYIQAGARTSAWESKLLSDSRLDELAESPKLEQIFTMLEDTDYRSYLGEISLDGGTKTEEFEVQMYSFLSDRHKEILKIAPEEREETVEKIVEMIDIRNLMGVLIGMSEGISREEYGKILVPSPILSEERLDTLSSAESMEDLLEYLKGSEYYETISEAFEEGYEEKGISPIIRSLDKAYYEDLWELIEGKKAQRDILRDIIGTKMDMMNIKTICRLKKEGVEPEEITDHLVPSYRITEERIKSMTAGDSVQTAMEPATETIYGQAVKDGLNRFEETGSLYGLEKRLDEEFLSLCRRSSMSQPFSIASVLAYMYLMENEVRNLRTIFELKSEDIGSGEIKNNLIRRREIEFQTR